MTEPEKVLQPLCRELPEMPESPMVDEDGEELYRGFNGDISQSPLYVTDGHILLLASAIDPAFVITRNDDHYARKYATEEKIGVVWKPAEARDEVIADFIGATYDDDGARWIAFLRDGRGRVPVVNAYLLAFGLRAVLPDALTVDAASIKGQWFDTSVALRREGKLVGLLMSMKLSVNDFPQVDFHGEAVSLFNARQSK